MEEPSLDQFLAGYPPEIHELVMETRSLIYRVIPNAIEMVDPPSKIVGYGLGRKYADLICAIAPYPKYVNLMFSKGAVMEDPDKRLEGTGKRARHIKVRSTADLEAPSTQALLEQALRLAKA